MLFAHISLTALLLGSLAWSDVHTLTSDKNPSQPKAFRRVVVFSGGGFNSPVFLGMLEGLEESGWKSDVIISTCGSSISAAIAGAFPTSEMRKEFVKSEAFHRLLSTLKMGEVASSLQLVPSMAEFMTRPEGKVPDIFSKHILLVPSVFSLPELDRPFSSEGSRIVMVGAKIAFDEKEIGKDRNGRKLYQQMFLTDEKTAECLRNIDAPIATSFPKSAIQKKTDVLTTCRLSQAARASISDPFYMPPAKIGKDAYLAGSVDLYPLETGKLLGSEVLMCYSAPFDAVEQKALLLSFSYDNHERLRQVNDMEATHWIDISDSDSEWPKIGLNPKKQYGISLVNGVPTSRKDYLENVDKLWSYGKERAKEALRTPRNSKLHIRNKNSNNTNKNSVETR